VNKIAFLFPGQGAQFAGMGKDAFEQFLDARRIFVEADKVLDLSLSRLCFEGPAEELTKTENCQPAILTVSIAFLQILKLQYPHLQPDYVAGLSLGEYAALVAGGIISFRDAVVLVRKRGLFMEQAAKKNPGKMSCILGLEKNVVERICEQTGSEVANLNCPGQVVISGCSDAIESANRKAIEEGAKHAILLDVSGAFHCSLMNEASKQLKAYIERVGFEKARIPLISNVDAREQTDPAVIKHNLIKQVNSATYWNDSMKFLLAQGVDTFLEIGPGTVLKGLMKKIEPQASVLSIGKVADLTDISFFHHH
jgi:[acyl-carrier-protein] S-malonyltransferase